MGYCYEECGEIRTLFDSSKEKGKITFCGFYIFLVLQVTDPEPELLNSALFSMFLFRLFRWRVAGRVGIVTDRVEQPIRPGKGGTVVVENDGRRGVSTGHRAATSTAGRKPLATRFGRLNGRA